MSRWLASIVFLVEFVVVSQARAQSSLSADEWRGDLAFMATEMERWHDNLYHTVSQDAFKAAVDDLHAAIPHLTSYQVVAAMNRLAASVGDAHT